MVEQQHIDAATSFLRQYGVIQPAIGLLAGTGLGGGFETMAVDHAID